MRGLSSNLFFGVCFPLEDHRNFCSGRSTVGLDIRTGGPGISGLLAIKKKDPGSPEGIGKALWTSVQVI